MCYVWCYMVDILVSDDRADNMMSPSHTLVPNNTGIEGLIAPVLSQVMVMHRTVRSKKYDKLKLYPSRKHPQDGENGTGTEQCAYNIPYNNACIMAPLFIVGICMSSLARHLVYILVSDGGRPEMSSASHTES